MKNNIYIENKIKLDKIKTILSNNKLYNLYKDKLEENSYINLYDFYISNKYNLNTANDFPTNFYLYIGNYNNSILFLEIETFCMYYTKDEIINDHVNYSILSLTQSYDYTFIKGNKFICNSYSIILQIKNDLNDNNNWKNEIPINEQLILTKYEKTNILQQGLFK